MCQRQPISHNWQLPISSLRDEGDGQGGWMVISGGQNKATWDRELRLNDGGRWTVVSAKRAVP